MAKELKSVKCTKVDRSTKNLVYVLFATFSNGPDGTDNCYIGKTVVELGSFRKNVQQLSGGSSNCNLPDLKEKKGIIRRDDKNKTAVDDFCQQLLKLPAHILKDQTVVNFFSNSSAADEDGAIKLLKDKEASKKVTRGKSDVASSPATDAKAGSTLPAAAAAISAESSPFTRISGSAYEEIAELTNRMTLVGGYSEVKSDSVNRPVVVDNNSDYAECRVTTPSATSPSQNKLNLLNEADQSGALSVYATVNKQAKNSSSSADAPVSSPIDDLYEDTSCFAASHTSEVYDDTSVSNHQRLPPPRPQVRGNQYSPTPNEGKPLQPKPSVSASPPSTALNPPLTQIPPMPLFASPKLQTPDTSPAGVSITSDETAGEIQVVAIADYSSASDNVLSFKKGTMAALLVRSDSNWWCIRLGSSHGWVPAAFWRMLTNGECVSLVTKGNSPWFVGKLSRAECEALLMEHGKQQHFVVRESDSGRYALSIKYNDRIHHFPIEVTPDKKYNIGKHDFKTVNNVILYYQKNALFHDESGQDVMLGSPLVIIKH